MSTETDYQRDITLTVKNAEVQLDPNSSIIYSISDNNWYDVSSIPLFNVPAPYIRIRDSYHKLLVKQNEHPDYAIMYDITLGYPVCRPKYQVLTLQDYKNFKKSEIDYYFNKAQTSTFAYINKKWIMNNNTVTALSTASMQAFMAKTFGQPYTYVTADHIGTTVALNADQTIGLLNAYNDYTNMLKLKRGKMLDTVDRALDNDYLKDLYWDTFDEKNYPIP